MARFVLFLLGLAVFLTASPDLKAEAARTSLGFFYDRFPLTLADGWRTEAAGPFYYFEQREEKTTRAFPPFFSCHRDPQVESHEDNFLYPLFTRVQYGEERRWQFFQLISSAGGQQPGGELESRFTLFPLYFRQRSTDTNLNYTAVAPFYGHLKNRLSRDEIFFVMFPFYSETRKRDVVTRNYFFPIGHVRRGDGLEGWQVWPFAGAEHKQVTTLTNGFGDVTTVAGHEKSFVLWPFWLKQDTGLGITNPATFYASTPQKSFFRRREIPPNPATFRASIPFFVISRSPPADMTSVIWPFFNWIDNREKQYFEWQAPWPFIIFARGEGKTTSRVFPFFGQSRSATQQNDFYLWPVYTHRHTHSDPLDLQRTRVLFYLWFDTVERDTLHDRQKRRLAMWPFFIWQREFNGNERLQIFAPLEPAVPNNRGIERNWSPLWSLWRAEKNPQTQAASHSLLWNLYRDDRTPEQRKTSLLFGLWQYQRQPAGKRIRLFYLPVTNTQNTPPNPRPLS